MGHLGPEQPGRGTAEGAGALAAGGGIDAGTEERAGQRGARDHERARAEVELAAGSPGKNSSRYRSLAATTGNRAPRASRPAARRRSGTR